MADDLNHLTTVTLTRSLAGRWRASWAYMDGTIGHAGRSFGSLAEAAEFLETGTMESDGRLRGHTVTVSEG